MNRFLKPPERVVHSFSNSDECVYNYLNENLDVVADLSITIISRETYCAPSTVFNLLKKLGFSGFKEFKFACQNYQQNITKISSTSENTKIFKKAIGQGSMLSTIENLNSEQILQVCEEINQADRVVVIANEITRFAAKEFVYRLQLCNVDIISSFDAKQYETLLTKETYDYIIVFSKYGNTEKIIQAMERTNSKIDVLITTNDNCYLTKYTRTKLLGEYNEICSVSEEIGDCSSRIALHIISDVIVNTFVYTYLNKD